MNINMLYWVTLLLAFFGGAGLLAVLHQGLALARRPAPARVQHRQYRGTGERESWVEDYYPQRSAQAQHDPDYWAPTDTAVDGPPYRVPPYAGNGQQSTGQSVG